DRPHKWGSRAFARPDAAQPADLVRFDLQAGAATVAAHAPLQLRVDPLGGYGQPSGHPLEDRHQAAAVRLTCRREPECHAPPSRADNNTRARLLVGLAQRSPPGHLTAPVARATGS